MLLESDFAAGVPGSHVFTRCSIAGTPSIEALIGSMQASVGLSAHEVLVTLWDTTVTGGRGHTGTNTTPASDGAAAVVVDDAFLFASGSVFTGGDGGAGKRGASCGDGGDGGSGLVLAGTSPSVELLGTTRAGGRRGDAGGAVCAPGADGVAEVVLAGAVVEHPQLTAQSLLLDAPVRAGEPFAALLFGSPFAVRVHAFSRAPLLGVTPPLAGVALLEAPRVATVGQLDATGFEHRTYGPLGLAAGAQAKVLFHQAAFAQLAPATALVWGAPSVLVVLDPTL